MQISTLTTARSLTSADSNSLFEITGPLDLSLPTGLAESFSVIIVPTGSVRITVAAGVQINGVAGPQTISGTGYSAFTLYKKPGANNFILLQRSADTSAPVYIGTWANRPNANTYNSGTRMIATDMGINGNVPFVTDGTYWRPEGGRFLLDIARTQTIGPVASGLQTLRTTVVPAGLWTPGSSIRIMMAIDKIGTVETMSAGFSVNGNVLSVILFSAANAEVGMIHVLKALDKVTLQRTGANNNGSATPFSTLTNNPRPAAITVPDMTSNPVTISPVYTLQNGTTDKGQLNEWIVEYLG